MCLEGIPQMLGRWETNHGRCSTSNVCVVSPSILEPRGDRSSKKGKHTHSPHCAECRLTLSV